MFIYRPPLGSQYRRMAQVRPTPIHEGVVDPYANGSRVQTLDFEDAFWDIVENLQEQEDLRTRQAVVKLFDGNWILRGQASLLYSASFQEIDSETGIGKIEMPIDYYLSQWVVDHDGRPTKNIHVTMEKDGVRWSGRMDRYEIDKAADGKKIVRVLFKHDYEEFKHILVWANPFLPDSVQFPRVWILFGPAKWCLKTTLFANIFRLESGIWTWPGDPMDIANWFSLDQSNWSMVVAPDSILHDTSVFAIVHSRFKDFHSVAKPILEDGELTPTFRRYLTGDPPPWPGANLRNGCLIIDIVDKSAWTTGTSLGGDIFNGLLYYFTGFTPDGYDNGTETIPDPTWPTQYYQSGFKGTLPQAPAIIFRESGHTGIQTSLFTGSPAKDVQHVTGGHSMPGVNELISAAINMAGDLIAAIIGVPPVGGAADAILKPLYTDVFLAFNTVQVPGRAASLGNSYYHERWADGADRGYTLKALISLRTSIWATRETFTHKFTVADGRPWIIGQNGLGQFYLGDRIGSTVEGTPAGKIYVDRVSEVTLSWDRKTSPTWEITIGQRKQQDPALKALERVQDLFGIAHDVGVW